jgi:hypothetical protein
MPIETNFIAGAAVSDQGGSAAAVLRMPPRARHDLYFVPGSYAIIGNKVRPQLKKLLWQAGVNNVEQTQDGRIDMTGARARMVQNKGATFLTAAHCPAHLTPDKQPGYMRRYPGVAGPVYLEAWELPHKRGARTVVAPDEEGYQAWLDHLMDSGAVPYPDGIVIDDLLSRSEHMRAAVESRLNKGARATEAASLMDEQLKVLDDARSKPTTKRKRTAKAAQPADEVDA